MKINLVYIYVTTTIFIDNQDRADLNINQDVKIKNVFKSLLVYYYAWSHSCLKTATFYNIGFVLDLFLIKIKIFYIQNFKFRQTSQNLNTS